MESSKMESSLYSATLFLIGVVLLLGDNLAGILLLAVAAAFALQN